MGATLLYGVEKLIRLRSAVVALWRGSRPTNDGVRARAVLTKQFLNAIRDSRIASCFRRFVRLALAGADVN